MQVSALACFCDMGGLLPSCIKQYESATYLAWRIEPHPFPLAIGGGQCRAFIGVRHDVALIGSSNVDILQFISPIFR